MTGSFTTRFGSAPEESAKAPCVASTTANIVLSGEQTIDTVSVLSGNRVLVRNQTDAAENGIYDASTGPWVRSTDFNNSDDVINGILVIDANQTNNGVYQVLFTGSYAPGTTSVTFTEILFNSLTSKTGSTGIQGEYNAKGQYHIKYMDDLIGVDLTSFVVGETVLCNALNLGALGTYSIWEKVADSTTPPDPATGLNAADNKWYSALTNATQFKQVRQLSCLTIADLKLISGMPNQIMEVISYDAPDFGLANPYKGNGKFTWDSTSTETDDSATTRTVIQATGVITGRWIRVYDALVDAAGNFTGTDVETALSECATKTTTQALTNKTLTDPVLDSPVLDGILTGSAFKDEDDMLSDSSLAVASQQSIKAYIDSKFAFRGARAFRETNQTILHDTATDVLFDAEVYDTDSIHSLSVNTGRLTVPSGVTKIRLSYYFLFQSGNDYTKVLIQIKENGSTIVQQENSLSSELFNYGTSTQNPKFNASSGVISVTAGDYYEIQVTHANSAVASRYIFGALTGSCWFSMEIIE